ncbi:MAG TPA: hypothetical protein ENI15_19035 [Spirochaetes bacterium]|nr:hypothetical protein [Spirochaetota bacterium]
MAVKRLLLLILLITGLLLIASCRPINIFSPLVDPSKMGNDAKLDAGYNAMADGDYDLAIDYFTDVIQSASGETLTEAYVGRGASYLNSASSNVNTVTEKVINGDLDISKPGAIIIDLVEPGGDYVTFFATMKLAAADYTSAMSILGADMAASRLQDTYETNMIAATGVGAIRIANAYTTAPWASPDTINDEIHEILKDTNNTDYPTAGSEQFHIDTWDQADVVNNGLYVYVRTDPSSKSEMMVYLTNADNACTYMYSNLPIGMSQQDITDMKTGISDWVNNGLTP